jgi:hypothetical protein
LTEYSETVRWHESSGYRRPDALESNQVAAIRAIGTNGIPTLLRMLRAQDSAIKAKLAVLLRKQTFVSFRTHKTSNIRNWRPMDFWF